LQLASSEDVLLRQKHFEGAGAKKRSDEAEDGKKMVGKIRGREFGIPFS